MFHPSKKMMFAVEAVLDIAYHAGSTPVQSKEITRRQGIPKRYLEQALQQLVRCKILVGVRGPKGGYRLARERRRISIGDIVRAVQNGTPQPASKKESPASDLGCKVVLPMWGAFSDEMMMRMDKTFVDDLCARANQLGIVSEGRESLDFSI